MCSTAQGQYWCRTRPIPFAWIYPYFQQLKGHEDLKVFSFYGNAMPTALTHYYRHDHKEHCTYGQLNQSPALTMTVRVVVQFGCQNSMYVSEYVQCLHSRFSQVSPLFQGHLPAPSQRLAKNSSPLHGSHA